MRKPLVARQRFPKFVDHITTFLARSLFFTSDLYLTGVEKKAPAGAIHQPAPAARSRRTSSSPTRTWSRRRTSGIPLLDDGGAGRARATAALKLAIAEMKEAYMTHAEALIHSDLHTGSIMVNAEDTRGDRSRVRLLRPDGLRRRGAAAKPRPQPPLALRPHARPATCGRTTRRTCSTWSATSGTSSPASSTLLWAAEQPGRADPGKVLGLPGRRGGLRGVPAPRPSGGCCTIRRATAASRSCGA